MSGSGADRNPICVGDRIQTRRNTSELTTSDHRRVLNRDVSSVTGRRDDGTVTAKHCSRDATVQITPAYLAEYTVLAYATTIAGAQGRNVDTGHAGVTPRTTAAALYVGMTRGRLRNHAHVVTDGHERDELQLGHRSGLTAFADAVVCILTATRPPPRSSSAGRLVREIGSPADATTWPSSGLLDGGRR